MSWVRRILRMCDRRVQPMSSDEQQARGGETVAEIEFEMFVMHVADFMKLTSLPPHHALRAAGTLVPWNASMRRVFFFSHEWTADDAPDYTHDQLRATQTLLTRMLCGECPDTAPDFVSTIQLSSDVTIKSSEMRELVHGAYIWLDCLSVSD